MIVYTLGNELVYDKFLKNNKNANKIGKTEDYEGGIIFLSIEEAKKFINSDYVIKNNQWNFPIGIYEVEILSINDIEKNNLEKIECFNLIKNSKIIKKYNG